MDKKEILDLIVKGFGVYLLVLAIIAIPKMFGAFFMLPLVIHQDTGRDSLAVAFQSRLITQSVGGIHQVHCLCNRIG